MVLWYELLKSEASIKLDERGIIDNFVEMDFKGELTNLTTFCLTSFQRWFYCNLSIFSLVMLATSFVGASASIKRT
jgi:hypothetical protein